MRYRWHALALVGMAALTASLWLGDGQVVGAQAGAQSATGEGTWTTPRTSWGDPDLEGIWRAEAVSTPLERPAQFGTREFLTDQELAAIDRELAALEATPARETEAETRPTRALGTALPGWLGRQRRRVHTRRLSWDRNTTPGGRWAHRERARCGIARR